MKEKGGAVEKKQKKGEEAPRNPEILSGMEGGKYGKTAKGQETGKKGRQQKKERGKAKEKG